MTTLNDSAVPDSGASAGSILDRVASLSPAGVPSDKWTLRCALLLAALQAIITGYWSLQFPPGRQFLGAGILEFAVTFYFALCLLMVQKRPIPGLLLAGLGLLLPPVVGMLKYEYLMDAAGFADLFDLDELVLQYGLRGWLSALAVGAVILALCVVFCLNLRRPKRVAVLFWMPAFVFWGIVFAKLWLPPVLAGHLPSVPSPRPDLAPLPGPVLYGNWLSFLRSALSYSDRAVVIDRLSRLVTPDFGFIDDRLVAPDRRNVYYVVLESFMDPLEIDGAKYSADPFSPLFQRWRGESGLTALAPVFGNRSAESEFESVCGLPVTFEGAPVVFPQLKPSSIDCLPHKLAQLGWHTETLTITDPRIYNYGSIYPRLGYQSVRMAEAVPEDDLDAPGVPSAASVLSHHADRIDQLLAGDKPFFTAVFGTFGHFPYQLDTARRPLTIVPNSDSKDFNLYVNGVQYTSQAVARFMEGVLAKDPSALVVVFGDHHPILRALEAPIDYPGDAVKRQRVPLMIVNGREGLVPLRGEVPLYHLPGIVSDLLTHGKFCEINACLHRQDFAWRPLPDALLAIDRAGGDTVDCRAAGVATGERGPLCRDAEKQMMRYQAALATMLGAR